MVSGLCGDASKIYTTGNKKRYITSKVRKQREPIKISWETSSSLGQRTLCDRDICNKNRPGFISADEFLEPNIPRSVRFNPKAEDSA